MSQTLEVTGCCSLVHSRNPCTVKSPDSVGSCHSAVIPTSLFLKALVICVFGHLAPADFLPTTMSAAGLSRAFCFICCCLHDILLILDFSLPGYEVQEGREFNFVQPCIHSV